MAGDDGEDRHRQGAAGVFGSSGGVEAKQGVGDSWVILVSRPQRIPTDSGIIFW